MVKTSLRTLLSHCSREHSEFGDFFFASHLHNNDRGPSSTPMLQGAGPVWSLGSISWALYPSGVIFSLHAQGFWDKPSIPQIWLVSVGRFAFAWEYTCGHLEYYSQVLQSFLWVHSQVITAGCSLLSKLGKFPGTGVIRHRFQWFKMSHGPLCYLSSCTDSSKLSRMQQGEV